MSNTFAIRRFRLTDMEPILEIERAGFGADAWDRNLFAEYARQCGKLFLVVERGRKVYGYSIACICGGILRRRAELESVAVDPAVRGKGAAAALMDSTLRRLRRRGIGRLSLMVKVTNQRARGFYEKYGFNKVRRVPRYYEDGADGFLLARDV